MSKNVRFLAYSDMEGRRDGCQVLGYGHYIFVGHIWSGGVSIFDVSDPKKPKIIAYIPSPNKSTTTINLQVADDLLLVANEANLFDLLLGRKLDPPPVAGLRIFDVSNPRKPCELSFYPVSGTGVHRLWYTGGRYAYLPSTAEGFKHCIFMVLDISDPKKPVEVSRWWPEGMRDGEKPSWDEKAWWWLHGPIVYGERAYCGWWDGGMIVLDISDIHRPKLVSRLQFIPPFAGVTHTCLPLPKRKLVIVAEEALDDSHEIQPKMIWVIDNRAETNPIPVATFPIPEGNFREAGTRFGPHNLHENRLGSFQSDTIIFNAYFDAGLRIFDISNAYRPEEIGHYLPPNPTALMDNRPGRIKRPCSEDVYVDKNGIMYLTDFNCGLNVLEYTG